MSSSSFSSSGHCPKDKGFPSLSPAQQQDSALIPNGMVMILSLLMSNLKEESISERLENYSLIKLKFQTLLQSWHVIDFVLVSPIFLWNPRHGAGALCQVPRMSPSPNVLGSDTPQHSPLCQYHSTLLAHCSLFSNALAMGRNEMKRSLPALKDRTLK